MGAYFTALTDPITGLAPFDGDLRNIDWGEVPGDNAAFLFIKPHAHTEETKKLVEQKLYLNRIRIVKEGSLPAEEIEKVIGLHYYSISSKAEADPSTLHVPAEKFKGHFNINWKEALESGSVYSAKKACEDFQLTGKELATLWARSKQLGKLCKLGGGFYVASVEIPGKKPIYVINGFYMEMKQKFTQPGSSIYFYVVDWDTKDLSWKDFRAYVLGTTDPTDAAEASLRGTIFKDWEKLGLKNKPNTGDNGVHASASPFEGLAERFNWLKVGIDSDPFGARAVRAGISVETLEKWSKDPVIDGKSIFDTLEDNDSNECLDKMLALAPSYGKMMAKREYEF